MAAEALKNEKETFGPQALNTSQEKLGEKTVPQNTTIDVNFTADTDALLKELGLLDETSETPPLTLGDEKEKETKYHTAASKVYEIANQFERDQSPLGVDQKKSLQDIKDWMPGFMRDEQSVLSAATQSIEKLTNALSNTTEDTVLNRLSTRIAELRQQQNDSKKRLHDLQVFDRYVGLLFVENNNRVHGEGGGKPNLNEAKQERQQDLTFSRESFEDDLIKNRGVRELQDLKSISQTFTPGLVELKKDYLDDSKLRRSRTVAENHINAAFIQIDQDIQKVSRVRAQLAVQKIRSNQINKFEEVDHIDELQGSLAALENTLKAKREAYQQKKDKIQLDAWNTTGEKSHQGLQTLRSTTEKARLVLPETKPFAELLTLRESLHTSLTSFDKNALKGVLIAQGMSDTTIDVIVLDVENQYVKPAQQVIADLDNKIFDDWKTNELPGITIFSEIESVRSDLSKSRMTAVESMALYTRLKNAQAAVPAESNKQLARLPQPMRVEAQEHIAALTGALQVDLDTLLEEAKRNAANDILKENEVKNLEQAIADAVKPATVIKTADKRMATDISVEEKEEKVRRTRAAQRAAVATIMAKFHPDLAGTVQEKLTDQDNRAQQTLNDLTQERTAIEDNQKSGIKKQLSDAVSEIANLNRDRALLKTPAELQTLKDNLEAAERTARDPANGIDIRDLDSAFSDARTGIDSYLVERKNISPEGIREQVDLLEKPFVAFDKQPDLWNELQRRLKLLEKIDKVTFDALSTEVGARKDLHANWMMIEGNLAAGKVIESIAPESADVTSGDLNFLFKEMPGVADAWRIFDQAWIPDSQRFVSIPQLQDVTAANFEQNKDRVFAYVASRTSGEAAKIAYRLQTILLRPSEFDKGQDWTGKDEIRQVLHITDYRRKYANKKRQAGPEITIEGFFNEKGNWKNGETSPVVVLPNDAMRSPLDPGWDLFPGFFHYSYEGNFIQNSRGVPVKKPKHTDGNAKGAIRDFASSQYRNVNNELMVEDLPWEGLEQDAIKSFYTQMKKTGKFIHDAMTKPQQDPSEMKTQMYYSGIMNVWQYLEPFIYGIRELQDEHQKEEAMTKFRATWLLGVVHNNFQVQLEGAKNWSSNDVRDVLKAAVQAGFITHEDKEWISSNLNQWERAFARIGRETAEKLQKPFVEAGGH